MTKDIAAIILQQLGGNKFITMTGAKHLSYCSKENYMQFKLSASGNKAGINCVRISLDGDDTYSMYFFHYRLSKTQELIFSKEQKFSGVYCDQLQSTFTQVTGLYTKL